MSDASVASEDKSTDYDLLRGVLVPNRKEVPDR